MHAVARSKLHHQNLVTFEELTAPMQVDEDGMREVNFELNGQKRAIMVKVRSVIK